MPVEFYILYKQARLALLPISFYAKYLKVRLVIVPAVILPEATILLAANTGVIKGDFIYFGFYIRFRPHPFPSCAIIGI
ncbi:hypothetical protein A1704_23650 [Chryseobacterium cucumeris]|nr:hypothetical protein A1704_23650 [Chryseobacterium cucumeris]